MMADFSPVSSPSTCTSCAGLLERHFDRRRLLFAAGAGFLAATAAPWRALASDHYEAMVLSCIDPRFQQPVSRYAAKRDLSGKYSHFVIAGAAIGVVADDFRHWRETFWDNLGTSMGLHGIERLIVINHRDCGAAKVAYGEDAIVPGGKIELTTHKTALAQFRQELESRQPSLALEAFLMDLEGGVEKL